MGGGSTAALYILHGGSTGGFGSFLVQWKRKGEEARFMIKCCSVCDATMTLSRL